MTAHVADCWALGFPQRTSKAYDAIASLQQDSQRDLGRLRHPPKKQRNCLLLSLLADPELKTLPRSKRRGAQRPAVRGCCSAPGPEELLIYNLRLPGNFGLAIKLQCLRWMSAPLRYRGLPSLYRPAPTLRATAALVSTTYHHLCQVMHAALATDVLCHPRLKLAQS